MTTSSVCQLLTPTARPARSYAPVVSDSLRPPGRLGDVSELWLALLKTQGEMWWPRLAGTLPGGARPSKAGPVPQQLPAPFGAGPKGSVRAHRTQRTPALSGFSECSAQRGGTATWSVTGRIFLHTVFSRRYPARTDYVGWLLQTL